MIDPEASYLAKKYLEYDIFQYMELLFTESNHIYYDDNKRIQKSIDVIENFSFEAMKNINEFRNFIQYHKSIKYLNTLIQLNKLYNVIFLYMSKYITVLNEMLFKNKNKLLLIQSKS